jgi:Mg2+ and Co2+ transporter CorA
VELALPSHYVRKDEFADAIKLINDKLDRISDKLDAKQDK